MTQNGLKMPSASNTIKYEWDKWDSVIDKGAIYAPYIPIYKPPTLSEDQKYISAIRQDIQDSLKIKDFMKVQFPFISRTQSVQLRLFSDDWYV